MKITIITATKNNGATINETIASVINQTHDDIDYIIIDGNSDDNSLDIIKYWQQKYPNKIRYISESDNGVYNAINKGIAIANGEIIGLLHGNDKFTNDNILSMVNQEMESKEYDILYGDIHFVKPNKTKCIRYYSSSDFTPASLLKGIAPPHPSLYVRSEIFHKYGTYKENYIVAADFELFVRLLLVNQLNSKYMNVDMVTMTTGGLSTRFYNRLFLNTREKHRALKENGFNCSYITLLKRYTKLLGQ